MAKTFRQFLDVKQRETVKHLNLVKQVLEKAGFKVNDMLKETKDDPYIFVYNPVRNTSFEGIRVYKIGDKLAYRVQRESKTHPYGTAYLLDIESMFDDLMEDHKDVKKVATELMRILAEELKAFFRDSAKAEKGLEDDAAEDADAMGLVYVRNPHGGDYSSMVKDAVP